MTKRKKKRAPTKRPVAKKPKSARAPANAKKKKTVASLMPHRGKAAKSKKAAYRLALLLYGDPHDPSRTVDIPTQVAELRELRISEHEQKCMMAALDAEEKNFPRGGVGIRYRIEFAATTLALIIAQAYSAAAAGKATDPDVFAEVAMELAIERARELWGMGPVEQG